MNKIIDLLKIYSLFNKTQLLSSYGKDSLGFGVN